MDNTQWAKKMADLEDQCDSVSVGGLAHDLGLLFQPPKKQYPKYPSMTDIANANYEQINFWYRNLRSPGMSSLDSKDSIKILEEETKILNEIRRRFKEHSSPIN